MESVTKLVRQTKDGDMDALNELLHIIERPLYLKIKNIIHNEEDTQDLVQEAMIRIYRNIQKFNSEYQFSTWMYRIATNICIDFLRKKKFETLSEEQVQLLESHQDVEDEVVKKALYVELAEAIKSLPEIRRKVISLYHFESLDMNQISEKLQMPLNTVKSHIFKSRQYLRNQLGEYLVS